MESNTQEVYFNRDNLIRQQLDEIAQLKRDIDYQQSNQKALKHVNNNLQQQVLNLKKENQVLVERHNIVKNNQSNEIDRLELENNEIRSEKIRLMNLLEQQNRKGNQIIEDFTTIGDHVNSDQQMYQQQIRDLNYDLTQYKDNSEEMQKLIKEQSGQISDQQKIIQELESRMDHYKLQVKQIRKQLKAQFIDLNSAQQDMNNTQNDQNNKEQQYNQLVKELEREQIRHKQCIEELEKQKKIVKNLVQKMQHFVQSYNDMDQQVQQYQSSSHLQLEKQRTHVQQLESENQELVVQLQILQNNGQQCNQGYVQNMNQFVEAIKSRKVNSVHQIRVEDSHQNGVVVLKLKEKLVELLQESKEYKGQIKHLQFQLEEQQQGLQVSTNKTIQLSKELQKSQLRQEQMNGQQMQEQENLDEHMMEIRRENKEKQMIIVQLEEALKMEKIKANQRGLEWNHQNGEVVQRLTQDNVQLQKQLAINDQSLQNFASEMEQKRAELDEFIDHHNELANKYETMQRQMNINQSYEHNHQEVI